MASKEFGDAKVAALDLMVIEQPLEEYLNL